MNFKKISALALTFAMSFSAMASATSKYSSATEYEAAMTGYNPTLEITVSENPITTKSDITSVAKSDYANAIDFDTYDYYKVTFNFSNVGTLSIDDSDRIGIYGITVGMKTTGIVSASKKDKSTKILKYSAGQNVKGYFQFKFNSDNANPYPSSEDGDQINKYEGTFSMDFIAAVNKGACVKVNEYEAFIVYTDGIYGADRYINNISAVQFGKETAAEKKWTFTKSAVTEKLIDSNKLWKLDVAKTGNPGDITSLSVKFTGKNGEANVETTRNFKASAIEALNGWNTDASFYVGLNNKNGYTDIDATFSGDAVTGTKVYFE